MSTISTLSKQQQKLSQITKQTALRYWSCFRSKNPSRIHQTYAKNAPKIIPRRSQRLPQSSQKAPRELRRASQEPLRAPNMVPKVPKGCPRRPQELLISHQERRCPSRGVLWMCLGGSFFVVSLEEYLGNRERPRRRAADS